MSSAHKAPKTKKQTFYKSELAPNQLLNKTQKFLEWHKGFNLKLRDSARGILVTDWLRDYDGMRYQYTLTINRDLSGSILAVHLVAQEQAGLKWKGLASDGMLEQQLIAELRSYIESSP